jgi:1,4-alpha-glucan branching enzyme
LSELDLFLFGEGTHRRLWEFLGAHPLPEGGVRFAVWAPNADAVFVMGDWNGWTDGTALQPQGASGIWAGVCADAAVGQRYKYAVVAGGRTTMKADRSRPPSFVRNSATNARTRSRKAM